MQSRTLHSRLTNFGSVTPWHDRDLEYAIAVSGDAFLQAGTSGESTVTGAFFGVQHQLWAARLIAMICLPFLEARGGGQVRRIAVTMPSNIHDMFCDHRTASDLEFNIGVSLIVGVPLPRDGGEALKRVHEACQPRTRRGPVPAGCDV